MKKLIILLALMVYTSAQTLAQNIEILPTMQSKTNAEDKVWVGTFQLVWNDFINKVVFSEIRFPEGTPTIVNELNKQDFTEVNLSPKDYYKITTVVNKNTKKKIAKAIKRKFNESSSIIDNMDLTPDQNKQLLYCMLKKKFNFVHAFDELNTSKFGQSQTAQYFGISPTSEKQLGKNVNVLFYNSKDDFAVSLNTKSLDEVFLFKTKPNRPFNYIYSEMLEKAQKYNGGKTFTNSDELKIPNIKFNEEKTFKELSNKRIKGKNIVIGEAIEFIEFNLNRTGVELKSEAGLSFVTTSLTIPRKFYFDDTFVIFLKEKGKNKPYFALRINDISKFQ